MIIAPTKELLNQVYMKARKFAHGTCVHPVVVYSGTSTVSVWQRLLSSRPPGDQKVTMCHKVV